MGLGVGNGGSALGSRCSVLPVQLRPKHTPTFAAVARAQSWWAGGQARGKDKHRCRQDRRSASSNLHIVTATAATQPAQPRRRCAPLWGDQRRILLAGPVRKVVERHAVLLLLPLLLRPSALLRVPGAHERRALVIHLASRGILVGVAVAPPKPAQSAAHGMSRLAQTSKRGGEYC